MSRDSEDLTKAVFGVSLDADKLVFLKKMLTNPSLYFYLSIISLVVLLVTVLFCANKKIVIDNQISFFLAFLCLVGVCSSLISANLFVKRF
jgi:hypothetical protein